MALSDGSFCVEFVNPGCGFKQALSAIMFCKGKR